MTSLRGMNACEEMEGEREAVLLFPSRDTEGILRRLTSTVERGFAIKKREALAGGLSTWVEEVLQVSSEHSIHIRVHTLPARNFATRGSVEKLRFDRLASTWKSECRFKSSLTARFLHPAYQQIIGMGRIAIPWILADLQESLNHWGWALNAITGEDPVPEEDAGDVKRIAEAWLQWGQQNGFLKARSSVGVE